MSILIAGSDAVSRHALRLLLQTRLALTIVGEAEDASELTSLAESTRANMVLLDGELVGARLAELISDLHQLEVPPDVIVLSSRREIEVPALAAGADAFVWKAESPRTLLTTVERLRLRRCHE